MNIDKHNVISFDVWLTLIKSNPKFKEARNQMIYNKYAEGESLPTVCAVVREVDVMSNKTSELTGVHVDGRHMVSTILQHLNEVVTTEMIDNCFNDIQNLFLEYLPTLYDENTKGVLAELHKRGKRLLIISNTGFINGSTVRKALEKLDILRYFDIEDTFFSDETGFSKPNYLMFRHGLSITLHVGDNPIADGGCVKADISFYQINSNNKSIKDLLCLDLE